MICSQNTLAASSPDINPDFVTGKDPFGCLNRDQKQKIEICFVENEQLKAELDEASIKKTDWTSIIITGLSMFTTGVIIGMTHK
jgi:hypothetical protein